MELPPPNVQPNDNDENEVAGVVRGRNSEIEQRRRELVLNNPHLSSTGIHLVSCLPLAEQREAMQRLSESHQILEYDYRRLQTLRRQLDVQNRLVEQIRDNLNRQSEELRELNRRLLPILERARRGAY